MNIPRPAGMFPKDGVGSPRGAWIGLYACTATKQCTRTAACSWSSPQKLKPGLRGEENMFNPPHNGQILRLIVCRLMPIKLWSGFENPCGGRAYAFCLQQLIRKCIFKKLHSFYPRHILPGARAAVYVREMSLSYTGATVSEWVPSSPSKPAHIPVFSHTRTLTASRPSAMS